MESNQLKSVVVAGASGLIGSSLMEQLIKDVSISKIVVLSRRNMEFACNKVQVEVVDFSNPLPLIGKVEHADVLFCCVGTTMKKAGSQSAFRDVDYWIPVHLAEMAMKAGIKKYIVISSLGADPESTNFYLRTKGEMERDISIKFQFKKLAFLRPSLLLGPRQEFRFIEKVGQLLMYVFSFLMIGRLQKYKPVHGFTVAKAMISISNSLNNQKVYESAELHWLGR